MLERSRTNRHEKKIDGMTANGIKKKEGGEKKGKKMYGGKGMKRKLREKQR